MRAKSEAVGALRAAALEVSYERGTPEKGRGVGCAYSDMQAFAVQVQVGDYERGTPVGGAGGAFGGGRSGLLSRIWGGCA